MFTLGLMGHKTIILLGMLQIILKVIHRIMLSINTMWCLNSDFIILIISVWCHDVTWFADVKWFCESGSNLPFGQNCCPDHITVLADANDFWSEMKW